MVASDWLTVCLNHLQIQYTFTLQCIVVVLKRLTYIEWCSKSKGMKAKVRYPPVNRSTHTLPRSVSQSTPSVQTHSHTHFCRLLSYSSRHSHTHSHNIPRVSGDRPVPAYTPEATLSEGIRAVPTRHSCVCFSVCVCVFPGCVAQLHPSLLYQ